MDWARQRDHNDPPRARSALVGYCSQGKVHQGRKVHSHQPNFKGAQSDLFE
ncbi:unnamed protein product [Dovyalis caffra]|uniref:Uncharacterized protein n=1 Tax=Dovyalis caffra TaxID=77055 RepID=A0AAV1SCJ7_9ROSI|nr:unnamed protein product [Dovyalis caffra]